MNIVDIITFFGLETSCQIHIHTKVEKRKLTCNLSVKDIHFTESKYSIVFYHFDLVSGDGPLVAGESNPFFIQRL